MSLRKTKGKTSNDNVGETVESNIRSGGKEKRDGKYEEKKEKPKGGFLGDHIKDM